MPRRGYLPHRELIIWEVTRCHFLLDVVADGNHMLVLQFRATLDARRLRSAYRRGEAVLPRELGRLSLLSG